MDVPGLFMQLQNLPPHATASDIRKFFSCYQIPHHGVEIHGGPSNVAFINFTHISELFAALQLDEHLILGVPIDLCIVKEGIGGLQPWFALHEINTSLSEKVTESTSPFPIAKAQNTRPVVGCRDPIFSSLPIEDRIRKAPWLQAKIDIFKDDADDSQMVENYEVQQRDSHSSSTERNGKKQCRNRLSPKEGILSGSEEQFQDSSSSSENERTLSHRSNESCSSRRNYQYQIRKCSSNSDRSDKRHTSGEQKRSHQRCSSSRSPERQRQEMSLKRRSQHYSHRGRSLTRSVSPKYRRREQERSPEYKGREQERSLTYSQEQERSPEFRRREQERSPEYRRREQERRSPGYRDRGREQQRSPEYKTHERERSPEYRAREQQRSPEYRRREQQRSPEYTGREQQRSPEYRRREQERSPGYRGREQQRSPEYKTRERERSPEYRRREQERSPEYRKREQERSPEYRRREQERSPEYRKREQERYDHSHELSSLRDHNSRRHHKEARTRSSDLFGDCENQRIHNGGDALKSSDIIQELSSNFKNSKYEIGKTALMACGKGSERSIKSQRNDLEKNCDHKLGDNMGSDALNNSTYMQQLLAFQQEQGLVKPVKPNDPIIQPLMGIPNLYMEMLDVPKYITPYSIRMFFTGYDIDMIIKRKEYTGKRTLILKIASFRVDDLLDEVSLLGTKVKINRITFLKFKQIETKARCDSADIYTIFGSCCMVLKYAPLYISEQAVSDFFSGYKIIKIIIARKPLSTTVYIKFVVPPNFLGKTYLQGELVKLVNTTIAVFESMEGRVRWDPEFQLANNLVDPSAGLCFVLSNLSEQVNKDDILLFFAGRSIAEIIINRKPLQSRSVVNIKFVDIQPDDILMAYASYVQCYDIEVMSAETFDCSRSIAVDGIAANGTRFVEYHYIAKTTFYFPTQLAVTGPKSLIEG